MTSLILAHSVLYWLATAALIAGAVGLRVSRFERMAAALYAGGAASLTLSIIPRWIQTGHPPIFGTYENTIAAVWSLSLAVLVLIRHQDDAHRSLGRALALWTIPLLAFGWFFDMTAFPLTISERSLLVDLHVLFAWSAHTVLLMASTAAFMIVRGRVSESEHAWLDGLMFRTGGYGFAALSLMIGVGSTYSYLLFGDWFKWEVAEVFAATAWMGYATAIHAALMFSWKGKRLAYAMLAVLPLMIATFWVWSIYSGTYHHFEIPAIKAS